MKVVILAGGFGTRISEESHLRPKPMIEIGDKPILWHIMKGYDHFGFTEFIICSGYKGDLIKQYFATYYLHNLDVTFDFTDGGSMIIHNNICEPWKVTIVDTGLHTQTGGRIKRIAPYVKNERFMMTYGDGVSDINISELAKIHEKSGKTVTLTAVQPNGKFGVLDINEEDGTVTGFHEKAHDGTAWINAGFMVLEPEVFNYIEDDTTVFERDPLQRLSSEGRLGVYQHRGYWRCMDTIYDREALEKDWKKGKGNWMVWE